MGDAELKLRKTHEAYILIILVSVIVVLVAVKWRDIPDLTNLLSFALTLSSLILALVAIGYAVYSNTSIERSVATLAAASDTVSESASRITSSSESLRGDLKSLSEITGLIGSRIDHQHGQLEKIAAQLETDSRKSTSPSIPKEPSKGFDSKDFVSRSSIYGAQALMACAFGEKIRYLKLT